MAEPIPFDIAPVRRSMGRSTYYPVTPWSSRRLYRPFVVAALGVGLTLGFTTGTAMLLLPMLGISAGIGWITHTQAHGVAQLFGWAGLFVVGIANHVVPRFRNASIAFPWLQRVTLSLVLAGIGLRFVGQTLSFLEASSALLVASGIALLAGILVFAGTMGLTLWRGWSNNPLADCWIWAGSLWALAAAGVHLAIVFAMAGSHTSIAPGLLDLAFVHAALMGFLRDFILGVSVRSVAAFLALPLQRRHLGWAAFALANTGTAWVIASRLLGAPGGWEAPGAVLEALGIAAYLAALRVFERRPAPQRYLPGTYTRYEWFVRAGFLWLLVGSMLLAAQTTSYTLAHTLLPALKAAPVLHVLSLGFVTMMIMGMSARMLPLFEGAQLRRYGLMDAAFVSLNASVLLRLVFGVVNTPVSTAALALSGVAGLLALVFFTMALWELRQANTRQTDIGSMEPPASGQPVSFVYPLPEQKSS